MTLIRLAFDTNVLVYSEELGRVSADFGKVAASQKLIRGAAKRGLKSFVSIHALAELHSVLVRKGGLPPDEAARRVRRLQGAMSVTDSDEGVLAAALELAAGHRIPIFDAMILAAAVSAEADILLSEDFQDGFAWRGVRVLNPFKETVDSALAPLLD